MKHIIKDQQIIIDTTQHLSDHDSLPSCCDINITVSLARWLQQSAQLKTQHSNIGVRLEGDDELIELLPDLDVLQLITLDFSHFSDGRCYSQARLLRERYAYKQELRAIGDVLQDQLFFMARCGINAFELSADQNLQQALAAFADFSVHYQTIGHNPTDRSYHHQQEALL